MEQGICCRQDGKNNRFSKGTDEMFVTTGVCFRLSDGRNDRFSRSRHDSGENVGGRDGERTQVRDSGRIPMRAVVFLVGSRNSWRMDFLHLLHHRNGHAFQTFKLCFHPLFEKVDGLLSRVRGDFVTGGHDGWAVFEWAKQGIDESE
jgi:hypothetical protein